MHWWGKYFFPAIVVFIILEQFGWSLWWMFGLIWILPMMFGRGGWCLPWMRDEHDDLPPRKRKEIPTYDYDPVQPIEGSRRIIRTSDGEILTAVEDPNTGMLILEE